MAWTINKAVKSPGGASDASDGGEATTGADRTGGGAS